MEVGEHGGAESMVEAFLLIQCEMGTGATVTAEIRKVPGVVLVHYVTGPYDLVGRVESEDLGTLSKLVDEVQLVPGITRTMTCPILKV
jgi:DNA-binding Lrp family transcriptional regulator